MRVASACICYSVTNIIQQTACNSARQGKLLPSRGPGGVGAEEGGLVKSAKGRALDPLT